MIGCSKKKADNHQDVRSLKVRAEYNLCCCEESVFDLYFRSRAFVTEIAWKHSQLAVPLYLQKHLDKYHFDDITKGQLTEFLDGMVLSPSGEPHFCEVVQALPSLQVFFSFDWVTHWAHSVHIEVVCCCCASSCVAAINCEVSDPFSDPRS